MLLRLFDAKREEITEWLWSPSCLPIPFATAQVILSGKGSGSGAGTETDIFRRGSLPLLFRKSEKAIQFWEQECKFGL